MTAATHQEQAIDARHTEPDFNEIAWPCQGLLRSEKRIGVDELQTSMTDLSNAVRTILQCLGEDPDREALRDTPRRYAEAMLYLTKGYGEKLDTILNDAFFAVDYDDIVIVKGIDFFSLCEHHLLPFFGKTHVGYIPRQRVIGLSKIPRVVKMLARRLQIQERLTKQVAETLFGALHPRGVAVVVEAKHLCMAMRGVHQTETTTVTECMLGCFQSDAKEREAFLQLVRER